jgi:DNA-binding PadR family transcriptional regulator
MASSRRSPPAPTGSCISGPGTLYLLLQRLAADGLVEPTRAPKAPAPGRAPGSPRRYYGVTGLGRAVLAAETRRLESAIADARAKRVLARVP